MIIVKMYVVLYIGHMDMVMTLGPVPLVEFHECPSGEFEILILLSHFMEFPNPPFGRGIEKCLRGRGQFI